MAALAPTIAVKERESDPVLSEADLADMTKDKDTIRRAVLALEAARCEG